MALKRADRLVPYKNTMGVVQPTGLAQMASDSRELGNEWEIALNKLGTTFEKISRDLDEDRMKTAVQKLDYELEDYETVDDEGNTVTATRVKEFKNPRFFWKTTQQDFEVLAAKKLAMDVDIGVRKRSLEIAEEVKRDGGDGNDYMLAMEGIVEGVKKSIPEKFYGSVRPKIEAQMIEHQAKVQSAFNDTQEKIKLDNMNQLVEGTLKHMRENILHNPKEADIARAEINSLPLEGLSGNGKIIRNKANLEIDAFQKFAKAKIGGVPMRELLRQTNLQGQTIIGKQELQERLVAIKDMINNVGDTKIILNGKEVVLNRADWTKATRGLTAEQYSYIEQYVNGRVSSNNAGLGDTISRAQAASAMTQIKSGQTNAPHHNEVINKLYKQNPADFVQAMNDVYGTNISPNWEEHKQDPRFWQGVVATNTLPKMLKPTVESIVVDNPDAKVISAMVNGVKNYHAAGVHRMSGSSGSIHKIMNTMEILPGASAEVNNALRSYSIMMEIDGKLDQARIQSVKENQEQLKLKWNQSTNDVNEAIRSGLLNYVNKGWIGFETNASLGVSKILTEYAQTWGPTTPGTSLTSKINNLMDKAYNEMLNKGIIGESEYNFVSEDFDVDWWDDMVVPYPLESYKIWNTDTQEMESSWHETAIVNVLKESAPAFGDEWEGNWHKLKLGDNIAVLPISDVKNVSLVAPRNIDYIIKFRDNDDAWETVTTKDGREIIYSPGRITALLSEARSNDEYDLKTIQNSINRFESVGNEQKEEELIREQAGIRATYNEVLKRLIPNYKK